MNSHGREHKLLHVHFIQAKPIVDVTSATSATPCRLKQFQCQTVFISFNIMVYHFCWSTFLNDKCLSLNTVINHF